MGVGFEPTLAFPNLGLVHHNMTQLPTSEENLRLSHHQGSPPLPRGPRGCAGPQAARRRVRACVPWASRYQLAAPRLGCRDAERACPSARAAAPTPTLRATRAAPCPRSGQGHRRLCDAPSPTGSAGARQVGGSQTGSCQIHCWGGRCTDPPRKSQAEAGGWREAHLGKPARLPALTAAAGKRSDPNTVCSGPFLPVLTSRSSGPPLLSSDGPSFWPHASRGPPLSYSQMR